jgi:hypothetical protein
LDLKREERGDSSMTKLMFTIYLKMIKTYHIQRKIGKSDDIAIEAALRTFSFFSLGVFLLFVPREF